jgi:hypothetical protein
VLFLKRFAAFRGLQECKGPSIPSAAGVLDLVALSDLQILLILLDPVLKHQPILQLRRPKLFDN